VELDQFSLEVKIDGVMKDLQDHEEMCVLIIDGINNSKKYGSKVDEIIHSEQ
jgi:hypothetical protein